MLLEEVTPFDRDLLPAYNVATEYEENIISAWLYYKIDSPFYHLIYLADKVTFILQDVVSEIKICMTSSFSFPCKDDLVLSVS